MASEYQIVSNVTWKKILNLYLFILFFSAHLLFDAFLIQELERKVSIVFNRLVPCFLGRISLYSKLLLTWYISLSANILLTFSLIFLNYQWEIASTYFKSLQEKYTNQIFIVVLYGIRFCFASISVFYGALFQSVSSVTVKILLDFR